MKKDPTKKATDTILAIYAADKDLKAKAVVDRAEDGANLATKAKELNTNPGDDADVKAAAKKEADEKAGAAMLSSVKKKG